MRDATSANDILENIVVHSKNCKMGFDSVSEVGLN